MNLYASYKPPLWISEADERGNRVASEVIAAAHRIWGRALRYVGSQTDDLTSSAEILEATCHCVSRALRHEAPDRKIHNLDAYLYWAFVRRFNRALASDARIQYVDSVEAFPHSHIRSMPRFSPTEDQKIDAMQFLAYLPSSVRTMIVRRYRGDSWTEIGKDQRISGHAAEMQFSRAIKKAKERMDVGRKKQRTDGRQAT
jgi:hypothetical protein